MPRGVPSRAALRVQAPPQGENVARPAAWEWAPQAPAGVAESAETAETAEPSEEAGAREGVTVGDLGPARPR